MRDPYQILGVPKTASLADIKKAYRRLAKANHPDKSKEAKAKELFNDATQAYDIIGDEKKREAFDRGEIDAEGKPRHPGFDPRARPGAGAGRQPGFDHFDFNFGGDRPGAQGADSSDIFADLFGGARSRQGAARPPARGEDIEAELGIDLALAANGGTTRVSLPTGRTLDIKIPVAVVDGQQIRLKGQGHPGAKRVGQSPPAGDVIITLRIAPHPLFRVDGRDLHLELPVTVYEAVLGGKVQVPTLATPVEMSVPPGINGGRAMRLRGKGLPNPTAAPGDLYVTLKIVLPPEANPGLGEAMQRLRDSAPYDPRLGLA